MRQTGPVLLGDITEKYQFRAVPLYSLFLVVRHLVGERVLHIDHMFARMQRLNTYEAKTNAKTRIGSNLSQVLPPPFICE
jgi:hypothetical protein